MGLLNLRVNEMQTIILGSVESSEAVRGAKQAVLTSSGGTRISKPVVPNQCAAAPNGSVRLTEGATKSGKKSNHKNEKYCCITDSLSLIPGICEIITSVSICPPLPIFWVMLL